MRTAQSQLNGWLGDDGKPAHTADGERIAEMCVTAISAL